MKKNKVKIIALTSAVLIGASALITGCTGNSNNKESINSTTNVNEEEDKGKSDNSSSEASPEFEKYVAGIHDKVKVHWPQMNKVWPSYDYDNHNFILMKLDEEQNVSEAWVMNSKEKRKLKKEEYEKIEAPQVGGYSELKFAGKPSIVMSVDDETMKEKDSLEEIYRVGTHEIVHYYYQKDIQGEGEGSRNQKYPSEETPRLYRRMSYDNLIKAYENPENQDEHIAKAKYWYEKWKTEFSDEYKKIKTTDIAESTARYTDNIGSFIKENMSEEEYRENAIKNIEKDKIYVSADSESYELGYVAALLLDKKQPEWKKDFYKEGNTIEEKLFENVQPIEEEADTEVKEKIRKAVEDFNKEREEKIKDVLAADSNKKIPYLKIDTTNSIGSEKSEGILEYKDMEISINYSNTFKVDGKNVEIKDISVMDSFNDDGKMFITVPLIGDSSSIDFKDGKLSVKSDNVKAESIKVKKTEEDGRTVYLAVAGK